MRNRKLQERQIFGIYYNKYYYIIIMAYYFLFSYELEINKYLIDFLIV